MQRRFAICVAKAFLFSLFFAACSFAQSTKMERIQVSANRHGFEFADSKKPFNPWGFNYDHDEKGRLIEDYWHDEWKKIEDDFAEIKALGANTVRIHLQFGKFMNDADKPNEGSLKQLADLIKLAERQNLYLDLTGLACYHKKDVPEWYDRLSEADRWKSQACFWKAVAGCANESPAILCYDLMNEPVVPAGKRGEAEWLGPAFGDKHFVQFISLDQVERPRAGIAKQWIKQLTDAIRAIDRRHLITVGLVDWSLDRPGLRSGFVPREVAGDLDFISVHIYPEAGKVDEALDTLKGFAIGKPVVIEETFPLKCESAEFLDFLKRSKQHASGWIGFYWGATPDELRHSSEIADQMMLGWLELFQQHSPLK